MATSKELLKLDLYALLGIGEEAHEKEIKKAYRQKALTCHPDKNPDNPQAAELFHQLSQALEVLTDAAAKAAYDKVRKAQKAAEKRTQKLDDRRKKVKLDLEAREREAQAQVSEEEEIRITRTLEQEIVRLREEGSRQLEEQQKLIQEQLRFEREERVLGKSEGKNDDSVVTAKLKLKWKCKKHDETKGGYSKDVLLRLLQKVSIAMFRQAWLRIFNLNANVQDIFLTYPYGEVLNLLISSKKKGSAVVEFATVKAAELAIKNETGLVNNPLKISWVDGPPPSVLQGNPNTLLSNYTSHSTTLQGSVRSERDYESLVMMRMRQAAERQQLIEQMQREDEEESNT